MSLPNTGLSPAQVRLWANLALAVIDIETTQDPRGGYRVVDVAVMTCRRGVPTDRWTQWVNPHIPIDARSTSVHGITDETVRDAPVFADVADRLLETLTAAAGEVLVVVVHNAGFDLPILRSELRRVGDDLPDLPVLDTARDLPSFAGVYPKDRSLATLCDTLRLPHSPQHQSVGDTLSLARAAISLLGSAAENGHDDITDILDQIGAETGDYQRQPRHISPMGSRRNSVPEDHWEAHQVELQHRATATEQDAWKATLRACAELRCEEASSLVTEASADSQTVIGLLDEVISDTAAAGDTPGVATLVGATMPYIRDHLENITTTMTRRNFAVKLYDRWANAFAGFDRCHTGAAEPDLCPDCLDYLPCPLDIWIDGLAAVAVGTDAKPVERFYSSKASKREPTNTFYRWLNKGRRELADAGLAAVADYWAGRGDVLKADRVAEAGWSDDCRHPTITARWAGIVAAPGGTQHIQDALDICDQVMAGRKGATSVAWRQLERTRQRFAGQLARLNGPPSGKRSRRPTQPKRTHPNRFVC